MREPSSRIITVANIKGGVRLPFSEVNGRKYSDLNSRALEPLRLPPVGTPTTIADYRLTRYN